MNSEKNKKPLTVKKVIKIVAAITAIASLICFIAPSVRKSDVLNATGSGVLTSMRAAASVISYYSAEDIAALCEKPEQNAISKRTAGLLAQLCTQQGYEKMYILSRNNDKKLQYIVDGSYRDNGKAGTDYFSPAMPYPTDNGYKAVKSVADKIYSGKSTGDWASNIITRSDFKDVVITCLPIYGNAHSVVAVLCVESDPGNTAFHMVGNFNLYYIGLILLAVFALCLLTLVGAKKFAAYREARRLAKEQGDPNAVIGVIETDYSNEAPETEPEYGTPFPEEEPPVSDTNEINDSSL